VCGALIQYPNTHGVVTEFGDLPARLRAAGAMTIVAADLLSLTVLTPPGEWGADVVVGSAQVQTPVLFSRLLDCRDIY
jgi:glycine dehydrogenase